eukprot:SAG22_NODE_2832_length_2170_cov_1.074360_3_plen_223_part_00
MAAPGVKGGAAGPGAPSPVRPGGWRPSTAASLNGRLEPLPPVPVPAKMPSAVQMASLGGLTLGGLPAAANMRWRRGRASPAVRADWAALVPYTHWNLALLALYSPLALASSCLAAGGTGSGGGSTGASGDGRAGARAGPAGRLGLPARYGRAAGHSGDKTRVDSHDHNRVYMSPPGGVTVNKSRGGDFLPGNRIWAVERLCVHSAISQVDKFRLIRRLDGHR